MGRGEMPDQPLLKTWRRRLRLSVRGLMALVLILGGGLGWFMHGARVQREAVATIKRAGGSVLYDLQPNYYTQARPWLPMWAIERLGIDFFGTVIQANLTGSSMTDAELSHLEGLTDLQLLYLPDTKVGDAGLAHLKGMSRLTMLILWKTKVGDAGLSNLAGLTRLRTLDLSDTEVTDAGLAHLEGLAGLEGLSLAGTHITDAGLIHLEGLTRLSVLVLDGTDVGDKGLEHLKGLKGLKILQVRRTRVSDAGLAEFRKIFPSVEIAR
jgi:Leucine Rich repeat